MYLSCFWQVWNKFYLIFKDVLDINIYFNILNKNAQKFSWFLDVSLFKLTIMSFQLSSTIKNQFLTVKKNFQFINFFKPNFSYELLQSSTSFTRHINQISSIAIGHSLTFSLIFTHPCFLRENFLFNTCQHLNRLV